MLQNARTTPNGATADNQRRQIIPVRYAIQLTDILMPRGIHLDGKDEVSSILLP